MEASNPNNAEVIFELDSFGKEVGICCYGVDKLKNAIWIPRKDFDTFLEAGREFLEELNNE